MIGAGKMNEHAVIEHIRSVKNPDLKMVDEKFNGKAERTRKVSIIIPIGTV